MAETLAMILGSVTGSGLKALGFVNAPSGTWLVKKGSLAINSANRSTHIPIVVNQISSSYTATSGTDYRGPCGSTGGTTEMKINGQRVGGTYAWAGAGQDPSSGYWSYTSTRATGYAYHVFIPPVFGMDLSRCQTYDCTATVWLEKK